MSRVADPQRSKAYDGPDNLVGSAFEWMTDSSLVNDNDYALELTQTQKIVLSTRFAISNATTLTAQTSSVPVSSSLPSSSVAANSATASATLVAATGRSKKLTKAGIVGVVIGVMAIFCGLVPMGVVILALRMMKKKGPPPASRDNEALGDDINGTPLTTITELGSPTGVSESYFPKNLSSSTLPVGKLPPMAKGKDRSGSASSSNASHYDVETPGTLVPPSKRDLGMIDGMSIDYNHSSATTAAPTPRNESPTRGIDDLPSPIDHEDDHVSRPIRSWLVGDDHVNMNGMAHPGQPYPSAPQSVPQSMQYGQVANDPNGNVYLHPNSHQAMQQQRRSDFGVLSPQATGDSGRTLTQNVRWSPTSPPAPSNLRYQMDR